MSPMPIVGTGYGVSGSLGAFAVVALEQVALELIGVVS